MSPKTVNQINQIQPLDMCIEILWVMDRLNVQSTNKTYSLHRIYPQRLQFRVFAPSSSFTTFPYNTFNLPSTQVIIMFMQIIYYREWRVIIVNWSGAVMHVCLVLQCWLRCNLFHDNGTGSSYCDRPVKRKWNVDKNGSDREISSLPTPHCLQTSIDRPPPHGQL